MIRRFQTPAEREAARKDTSFSDKLTASLLRSEAKVHELQHPNRDNPLVYSQGTEGSIIGIEEDIEDRAQSKDDGWKKWKEEMGLRFMWGKDDDFDYATVDENDDFDDQAEEDRQSLEEYLQDVGADFNGEGLEGETGVQDY
jgi:hypothetical protein